jgi:hypothetical protein
LFIFRSKDDVIAGMISVAGGFVVYLLRKKIKQFMSCTKDTQVSLENPDTSNEQLTRSRMSSTVSEITSTVSQPKARRVYKEPYAVRPLSSVI